MSRIILVRHGPSAHRAAEHVFDRAGLLRWREAHDAAGIQTMGATLINLAWTYRIVRGSEVSVPEYSRAAEAANWLAELVADGSTALVVTHGVFRRLVRQQLLARGWVTLQRHGGYRPWSSWHLADSLSAAANPPLTEIIA